MKESTKTCLSFAQGLCSFYQPAKKSPLSQKNGGIEIYDQSSLCLQPSLQRTPFIPTRKRTAIRARIFMVP